MNVIIKVPSWEGPTSSQCNLKTPLVTNSSLLRKKTQLRKVKRTLDIEERMLFHGTGHSNIQAICTFNFDWRLTGSHGDVYGKGTCTLHLDLYNKILHFDFIYLFLSTSTHRKLLCPGCQILQ